MAEYTEEQFVAAKGVGSKEELIVMASGAGVELTDEEADRFMELVALSEVDPQSIEAPGEISVEELVNVAGGYCKDKRGREIVTEVTPCMHGLKDSAGYRRHCSSNFVSPQPVCEYLSHEKGIYYCNYNVKPH